MDNLFSFKFLNAQQVNSNISLPKPALKYTLHRDIIYKNTPENILLKLDIYQSKKLTGT